MSSSENGTKGRVARAASLALLCLALLGAPACTVQPLYDGSAGLSGGKTRVAGLDSISIKPESSRVGQAVRNQLIFLLGGGSGQPANAKYNLTLGVVASVESSASVQRAGLYEPTASTVTMTSNYVLTDAATGETKATGKRFVSASYDVPRQSFAAQRAALDAQDRAARELAELVQLSIAQDLSKLQ
jgi:LPS-assembly lipoprotein